MNKYGLFMTTLLLAPSLACAGNWQIDPARSKIGFQYQAMGATLDGEFKKYLADIQLDPARPERAVIRMEIATSSIDAGNPDATAEAGSPLFFDSRRHPTARFTSTRIAPRTGGRYDVEGTLTAKGISRPLRITTQLKPDTSSQRLTGTFLLNRQDFKIGEGMWADPSALANEVRIAFSLLLVPTRAP